MSQSAIFQSCRDGANASWVLPVLSESKILAQGHIMAEVGFEPRPLAPESDDLPLSHRAPLFISLSFRICAKTKAKIICATAHANQSFCFLIAWIV